MTKYQMDTQKLLAEAASALVSIPSNLIEDQDAIIRVSFYWAHYSSVIVPSEFYIIHKEYPKMYYLIKDITENVQKIQQNANMLLQRKGDIHSEKVWTLWKTTEKQFKYITLFLGQILFLFLE